MTIRDNAEIQRCDGRVEILHVEAPLRPRGKGAAGRLMHTIAEHTRRRDLLITPLCGYARMVPTKSKRV